MDVSQRAMWVRDWASDLAGFEIEHIRKAFRDWRLSGQTKFPTPGQIMPTLRSLAEPKQERRKEHAWSELSEAEYQALDLPGKERHHLIMASQCEMRAGPMWRDGKPLAAEDLSSRYHDLRERAANHRGEAKRLRELYRRVEKFG